MMVDFCKIFEDKSIQLVSEIAESLGIEAFVVGGYVRDLILGRPSKDIDILTIGKDSSEILSTAVKNKIGKYAHLSVFKTFGTAQVKWGKNELEFVTARKESYRHDSRNPECEPGSLEDDLTRRDFTLNAMCIRLSCGQKGELIDLFNGLSDLENKILRTPCDPVITFSDDPLRMMRCVRFASTLEMYIEENTYNAIVKDSERIKIISMERVKDELVKIMKSPRPSVGLYHMLNTGLMKHVLPEIAALSGIETRDGRGHKDNFHHTMQVVDSTAKVSDNEWLRIAALLHDIGKPKCKKWEDGHGWSFHGHEYVGTKMVPKIFKKLTLSLGNEMAYVQKLVLLHMRPINLIEDDITDSAIRRLLFEAGDDIDDLMILCHADITSNNALKRERFHKNYENLREKMKEIEEKDHIRMFQPPVSGDEIMTTFNLPPCRQVGEIKEKLKDAILDGIIPNDRNAALELMHKIAGEMGLVS